MPLHQVEVQICGTVYVKAQTEKEAEAKVKDFIRLQALEFSGSYISGRCFDDPLLPDLSLSPMFTGHGIWPGATLTRSE